MSNQRTKKQIRDKKVKEYRKSRIFGCTPVSKRYVKRGGVE